MDFSDPIESVWPSKTHSLFTEAVDDRTFSDLTWQRLDGLTGRIMGFRRAAEMLYEQLVGKYDIRDLDTVVYPYAACWRHYLELQLKSVLVQVRFLTKQPVSSDRHHRVDLLWNETSPLLIEVLPSDTGDIRQVGRLVGELAKMDPDGQGFRYAEFAKGGRTLGSVDRINLVAFHVTMTAIANFLDGAATMLGEYVSTQHDIDSYYAEEFGSGW